MRSISQSVAQNPCSGAPSSALIAPVCLWVGPYGISPQGQRSQAALLVHISYELFRFDSIAPIGYEDRVGRDCAASGAPSLAHAICVRPMPRAESRASYRWLVRMHATLLRQASC